VKHSEIARKLSMIDHRDTAMRYVWRCGTIIKDERIEVRGIFDLTKLGEHRYRLAQPEENFGHHRFLTIELDGVEYWFHMHNGMCMNYRIAPQQKGA
jgi:hypothetical protein